MDNTTIVTLDLRGTKFKTLKSTFDKLDFSRVGILKTGDNEYFIDKDPKHFHMVLDYAKSGLSMHNKFQFYSQINSRAPELTTPLEEGSIYGLCTCDLNIGRFSNTCQKHNAELAEHMKTCKNGYDHNNQGGYALCRWWSKE